MALMSRILLATILLALTASLGAKCPNNFVKVRGKIECAIKPGYQVLVTLIYSDKPQEGVGEETALEIQDNSFKGEVAYKTFVSSTFLSGDICGKTPKGVLVRLIAGDGTEWDRKKLKVADDFRYDQANETFTLQSDIVLRGWCEPKCSDSQARPCANPK